MILAGTIGNLYDRVVFGGVRDFLMWYAFKWPIFNVADCCLVCGASLLLLQALFVKKPASASASGVTGHQCGTTLRVVNSRRGASCHTLPTTYLAAFNFSNSISALRRAALACATETA